MEKELEAAVLAIHSIPQVSQDTKDESLSPNDRYQENDNAQLLLRSDTSAETASRNQKNIPADLNWTEEDLYMLLNKFFASNDVVF